MGLFSCRSKGAELDPKALSVWYTTIANIRTELANWTARQSKHAAVGFPIITILLCLEDTPSFMQFIDTLMENLHRQLKACLSSQAFKLCVFSILHGTSSEMSNNPSLRR